MAIRRRFRYQAIHQDVALAALASLTPVDITVMVRKCRFHRMTLAAALVTALEGECKLKAGQTQPIMFNP